MSNHTPGPWIHHVDDNIITDSTGRKLIEWQSRSTNVQISVRDANARLIAAAPDLLETLQGILCVIYNACDIDEYEKLIKEMQSAIEKATGESA